MNLFTVYLKNINEILLPKDSKNNIQKRTNFTLKSLMTASFIDMQGLPEKTENCCRKGSEQNGALRI